MAIAVSSTSLQLTQLLFCLQYNAREQLVLVQPKVLLVLVVPDIKAKVPVLVPGKTGARKVAGVFRSYEVPLSSSKIIGSVIDGFLVILRHRPFLRPCGERSMPFGS
jgi:hypothetical protein